MDAGERRSLFIPLAAYALTILLSRPWGNYPLDDGWIFTRIGKRYWETGRFVFDYGSGTGPAFVAQAWLAAPVVHLLGFSHTHLRALTLLLGAAIVCLLWLLLRYADVRPAVRTLALLAVVWNPLFSYLSFTFMTEIYSYFFALLGAVIWMRDRRAHPKEELVSWSGALLSALAIGASFWIRQYSILVFPALLAATPLAGWDRVRRSAPRLIAACLVLAAIVQGFFYFARHGAEIPLAAYSSHLSRIWPFNPGAAVVQLGIFVVYMTAFFFPLLLARKMRPAGILLIGLAAAAALVMSQTPSNLDLHPHFPFLENVVRDTGVGPVLLPDVHFQHVPGPAWPAAVWIAIECLLLAAAGWWAAPITAARGALRERGLRAEILLFALLLSAASLGVTTLMDRLATFDRYYLPEVFGLALALAILLPETPRAFPARAAALLPLAFFTIAGLHDYFRWNDAAWDLYRQALHQGVSPAQIEAGYEMNGWYAFDLYRANTAPAHCDSEWFCLDDTYRLGMSVPAGYAPIAQRRPSYWLAPGPPVVLSKRTTSR